MRHFCLFILLLNLSFVFGQSSKTVHHHLDKITIKSTLTKDTLKNKQKLEAVLLEFKLSGYLGVSLIDSITKRNTTHFYYKYEHHFTKVQLIESEKSKNNLTVRKSVPKAITTINEQLIHLENSGFPFANISITNQDEKDDLLTLTYKIDSGTHFTIDKIWIKSQTDFHEKTVLTMMGIKAGEQYNEEKIRNIPILFANTEMYKTPKAPEVLFREGKAELYVYIEKRKSSNADGYVGFQQDRITESLVLNGFINLELKNALNRAEIIHLNWKNNPDKTQDLKTIIEYPYLFGFPFGVGVNLDLQKQDTSFVRSDVKFEIIYRKPQFRISLFDQIESSSSLSSVPISGFRDFSKNTVGLTVQYRPFMPDRLYFYHPKFTVSGGFFSYRSDTISDQSRNIANNKYDLKYEHQIDFLKFFHLNNSIQYQGLASSIPLSRNEFIYFGGLQSVRGFYELELAGKENWILRNEIEFKPIELLSLKVLYDYSNFSGVQKNFTHSFGAGFGLINNSSQLEIIIANGILNDNPISLSDTKVHIGFRSNF